MYENEEKEVNYERENNIKTVTDIIGEQYVNWKSDDVIFISAPTGAGKTTFVFDVLIPFAAAQGKKVLYLVNRKILEQQIKHRIPDLMYKLRMNGIYCQPEEVLEITTYQHIEQLMKSYANKNSSLGAILDKYFSSTYIVMDEAHYFMADSLFNTSTEISYNNLVLHLSPNRHLNHCGYILIFMSATNEYIEKFFMHKIETVRLCNNLAFQVKRYNIQLKDKYRDLNIHLFYGYETLSDVILRKKNEKWLVFVDDKEKGKILDRQLKERKIKSIFIDREFEKNPDTAEEVRRIVEAGKGTYTVCILTYVLDCGVSVEENRNNVVIFADNDVEFIQCLGRVRTYDYADMNLYIPIGKKKNISQRLTMIKNLHEFIHNDILSIAENEKYIHKDKQWILLEKILNSSKKYSIAKKIFYIEEYIQCNVKMGTQYMTEHMVVKNDLSIAQADYLRSIYEQLDYEWRTDEWCFVKMQLSWLKREDGLDEIIAEYTNDTITKCRKTVENYLESVQGVGLKKDKAREGFNLIREALYDLVKDDDEEIVLGISKQKPITILSAKNCLYKRANSNGQIYGEEMFNGLMRYLNFPYTMKKEYGGEVFIYRNPDSV